MDWFTVSAQQFKKFLATESASPSVPSKGLTAGGVVSPWVSTPVPWYSVALALLFKRRGLEVTIIWDDLPFEKERQRVHAQNEVIRDVLNVLANTGMPIVELSKANFAELSASDEEEVQRLGLLTALWLCTSSLPIPELVANREHCTEMLLRNYPLVKGFMVDHAFDFLVVPGGIYRNSGLLLHAARQLGRMVSTFDSGPISVAVGVNQVAAQFMDLPETYLKLVNSSREIKLAVIAKAKEEFFKRLAGKDKYSYQRVAMVKTRDKIDVLIPLNIDTDATALGKSRFFETSWHWLVDTVDFLLAKTDAKIVVRQHPHEAKKPGNRLLLGERLIERFPSERLRFYSCYDKVNTYDLLRDSRIVLPYVSSLGLEAAMLGKHVVLESSVYYATLPFVELAHSREDYFARIVKALSHFSYEQDPKLVEGAFYAYYLSTICGGIWTDFTTQPVGFERWVDSSVTTLSNDESVSDILDALAGLRSITAIQHGNYMRQRELASQTIK